MSINLNLQEIEAINDVKSILAEMKVLEAAFNLISNKNSTSEIKELICNAIKLKQDKCLTFEDKLAMFCMLTCLEKNNSNILPLKSLSRVWTLKTFEAITIGWSQWIQKESDEVLSIINQYHKKQPKKYEKSIESLILKFYTKAVELLIRNQDQTAQRFFEQSLDISSHHGSSMNPMISWVYVTSFYKHQ
jgi:hypothetical protein